MFERIADLPWSQRLGEVSADHDEEDAIPHSRCAPDTATGYAEAVGWFRTHDRLHTGDPDTVAATPWRPTTTAPKEKFLLICDTWEMADALNARLHDDLIGAQEPAAPRAPRPRDRHERRHHEPQRQLLDRHRRTRPLTPQFARRPSPQRQPLARHQYRPPTQPHRSRAGHRPSARCSTATVYASVTLGYASTVHSKQGVTADRSHAILSKGATRSMAYVAMTRGRNPTTPTSSSISAANPTTSTPGPSPLPKSTKLLGDKICASIFAVILAASHHRRRSGWRARRVASTRRADLDERGAPGPLTVARRHGAPGVVGRASGLERVRPAASPREHGESNGVGGLSSTVPFGSSRGAQSKVVLASPGL